MQTLTRIDRIERHIGATGLENGQQAHQHVQRALDTQAHQHIGANAESTQVARQTVGTDVQFAVAEGLSVEADRRCPGIECHPFFEQVVQAAWRLGGVAHLVPFAQQPVAFFSANHRFTVKAALRRLQALPQQLQITCRASGSWFLP